MFINVNSHIFVTYVTYGIQIENHLCQLDKIKHPTYFPRRILQQNGRIMVKQPIVHSQLKNTAK